MAQPSSLYKTDGSYLDPEDPGRKVRKVLKKKMFETSTRWRTLPDSVKLEKPFLKNKQVEIQLKDELPPVNQKVIGKREGGDGRSSESDAGNDSPNGIIGSREMDLKIPKSSEDFPKTTEEVLEAPPPPSIKQPSPARIYYAETPSSENSDGPPPSKLNEAQAPPHGGSSKDELPSTSEESTLELSISDSSRLGKMYFPGDPSDDSSDSSPVTPSALTLLFEDSNDSIPVGGCAQPAASTNFCDSNLISQMEKLSISEDKEAVDPSVVAATTPPINSIQESATLAESSSGAIRSVLDWVMNSRAYWEEKTVGYEDTDTEEMFASKISPKKSSKQKNEDGSTPSSDKLGEVLSTSEDPLKKTISTPKRKSGRYKSGTSWKSFAASSREKAIQIPEKYVDDVAPPPKGFPGRLADRNEDGQEYWRRCPYDNSHTYLRPMVHLTACRDKHLEQCGRQGKDVAIQVCRHTYEHHIPVEQLAEHEAKCEFGSMLHTYLVQWAKDERVREAMEKAKASNAPPQ